jgi:hypothetical protein
MRPIHEGEIRFVGEEVQFHGAARRLLERIARKSRLKGHAVSPQQVAEGIVATIQADLLRAMEKRRS